MIITTIWIVGRQIIKSAKFTSTKRIIASSISLIARAIMKPVRRKLLIECAHKVKLHATYAPVRTNAAPEHAIRTQVHLNSVAQYTSEICAQATYRC